MDASVFTWSMISSSLSLRHPAKVKLLIARVPNTVYFKKSTFHNALLIIPPNFGFAIICTTHIRNSLQVVCSIVRDR